MFREEKKGKKKFTQYSVFHVNRWWLSMSILRLCLSCLLQGHGERKRTEEDGGNERRRRGLLAEEGQKAASLLLLLIPTFPRGYHGFPLTLLVIPFHPIPSPLTDISPPFAQGTARTCAIGRIPGVPLSLLPL